MGHLGLAIDHYTLAAGQVEEIDTVIAAVEGQRKTVMRQAFAAQALIRADLFHELHRAFFQHAGADTAEDVILADPVENDGLDAFSGQKLAKQKP